MTIDWAEWGPPLAVLAFGVLAATVSMMQMKRREDATVDAQGREQDLVQAHQAAVEALKSLDLDQGKLDPSDYAKEREALVARGAAALRELEAFRAGAPLEGVPPATASAPSPQPTGPAAKPLIAPEWKGALTALAAVALLAILWQFAQTNSVNRREGASMTGNQDLGGAPSAEAPWMAAKAQMEAQLAQEPNNVELLNNLTQLSLSANDPGAAMRYNQRAFEVDAQNADARVYKAVLAATVGMFDRAVSDLDAVIATHPDNEKAWTYKGLILLEQQKGPEAVAALEKAVALQPNVPPLQQALAQARMMAGQPAPAGGPMAGGPMAGGPMAGPTGANPPGEIVISGVAELAPDKAAALTGNEIVYVSVRDPAGGPPLAAVRLPVGSFPLAFQVTTSDAIAMGGQPRPFPATMNLSVRIDADGNPMTKQGEPGAELQGVAKGATDLKLQLQ